MLFETSSMTYLCVIALWLFGCGKTADDLPQTVGKFSSTGAPAWSESGYYSGAYSGERYKRGSTSYRGGDESIDYLVTVHSEAEMATAELHKLLECPKPDDNAIKPYQQSALKTKDGRDVGELLVCRSNGFWAGNEYLFAIRRDTKTFSTGLSTKPALAVEFLKALPVAADLDLSMFDQVVAKVGNGKSLTEAAVKDANPPTLLAPEPYIKGKTYVVASLDNASMLIDDARKAMSAQDIETIVKVTCEHGSRIADYTADGLRVPAYSTHCKVDVIDFTIPAVIARKVFVNVKLPERMSFKLVNGKPEPGAEAVASVPFGEIRTYLAALPQR